MPNKTDYIKLMRSLKDHELWLKEPFTRGQAWVDLLMLAAWKDGYFFKRGNQVKYTRGTVTVSVKGLADRWDWSMGKVNRFLELLKNENQIEYQKTNVTTLIYINNYDDHQGKEKPKRKPSGNQTETLEEGKEVITTTIGKRTDIDQAAFAEFTEFRKKMRKPLSELAAKKAANLLAKLPMEKQQDCIDYSIAGSYQGLFPERFMEKAKNEAHRSVHERRDSVSTRIREKAKEAATRLGGGGVSEDGGDLPTEVAGFIPK